MNKYIIKFIAVLFIFFAFLNITSCNNKNETKDKEKKTLYTFCNPLNLSYRYQLDEPSRREAADPTVINFKGNYFLFASKSGGYWTSTNLKNWKFIETSDIPTEEYAPTAIVIKDMVYFLASSREKSTIYKSSNPLSGKWTVVKESLDIPVWDPAFYLDDDSKLYLYWGCSNIDPIYGVELDYKNNFSFIGSPKIILDSNHKELGWERRGDYNTRDERPYIEGPWMIKHKGKYHLQYASPGTQFKSYSDAIYISDNPLNSFKLAAHNPFSYKPEGFIAGAGHGSTFQDEYGNYWYMGTMSLSVAHKFERRLGLFPAFFDEDNNFYTYTGFGDFPHEMPNKKMNSPEDYQPSGMLLSYNKPVQVSSFNPEHPKENAVNEEIRKYWSAISGNKGEWILIDLEKKCEINSIQINFADEETNIFGRKKKDIVYQYLLEYSEDKITWKTLIDKRNNTIDAPHDFSRFNKSVSARYIRLINYGVPDGNFAISGFRVFGHGGGAAPKPISSFSVKRNIKDGCVAFINWKKNTDAIGYNIRYGIHPEKLYLNYQVFDADSLTIRSLFLQEDYYFTIDAINENGITKGALIQKITSNKSKKEKILEWQVANLLHSKNATISGNPKTISSPYGTAVLFNGKNDGIFLDTLPLKNMEEFTIEMLVRFDSGGGFEQRFFHSGAIQKDRALLEMRSNADTWYFDGFVMSGNQEIPLISPELLHPLNDWYHVAFTVKDGNQATFVNGIKELEGDIKFTPILNGKTSIGVRQNKISWFKGAIYKLKITNRVLQPSEFIEY